MGLNGDEVHVLRTVRHQPVERDVVQLTIAGHLYPYEITSNHRIVVEGTDGGFATWTAESLAASAARPRVFDGRNFRDLINATTSRQFTEVVEVVFANDAIVPAWILPRRASSAGRAHLRDDAAVCCRGARLRVEDFLIPPEDCGLPEQMYLRRASRLLHQDRPRPKSADGRLQAT